jgi:hypothetical protein
MQCQLPRGVPCKSAAGSAPAVCRSLSIPRSFRPARSGKPAAAGGAAKAGKAVSPTHVAPQPGTKPPTATKNLQKPVKPSIELTQSQLGSIVGLAAVMETIYLNGECFCYIGAGTAFECLFTGLLRQLGMLNSRFRPQLRQSLYWAACCAATIDLRAAVRL